MGWKWRASAETTLTIAADTKHLGARIGMTSVLHTWGSAMTHHPHVHMIVPGGGLSADGSRWVPCRPDFFLSVRVLSRLFRRLFLDRLVKLHDDDRLTFFGDHAGLADKATFDAFPEPLRKIDRVVYAKDPFAGSKAVLAYLARYTHRVAISNSRLIALDERGVTFRVKDCGVDILTDGEQRRENYIHYHCRHLTGFDFEGLTSRTLRDGAYTAELPTIRGKIEPRGDHFLDRDYRVAQSFTDRPVKITVPGPTTIMDTCANAHYSDGRALAFDLADALNYEIRALAEAGCRFIQVDEPLFARNVERALDYGVDCLDRCFDGVPDDVTRVMHICCGYPDHLDDEDYHKADPSCYFRLAEAVDASSVNQISIEDAHRYNDLSLLEKFRKSTVIFGSVAIAQSRLEPVEEIAARLTAALGHIDRDRLVAAPDCGLALLGRDLAMAKLSAMCEAARAV